MLSLKYCLFAALVCVSTYITAQNPDLLAHPWPAQWIAPPGISGKEYGVFHFRKTISLTQKPATYRVLVSADNRYKLYVNGQFASLGPVRGDLLHWNYATVDLAPLLHAGENILAAVVWNFGDKSPLAQISLRTGLLLQGQTAAEMAANTDTSWRVLPDPAYSPRETNLHTYYVAGPGEALDAAQYPWGWATTVTGSSAWQRPQAIQPGIRAGYWFPWYNGWYLEPDPLPAMRRDSIRIPILRQAAGIAQTPPGFPQQKVPLHIPPQSHVQLLFDQNELTTAYCCLQWAGGRGARIRIGYAESLFEPNGRSKGNRNEVASKSFIGISDSILADGGAGRTFETLWWRTWRYLQLDITTADEVLTINDLYALKTGYPFVVQATCATGDPSLDSIFTIGWRTAQACANETYMDCPYYEQLQYIGDTRIQALVSYYMTGDDRLARQAIEDCRHSLSADGITTSRYPSREAQYIGPFSLYYIAMVHDFWRYRSDPAFVQTQLPAIRSVLSFFEQRLRADGTLGHLPHWNYTDWVGAWPAGIAPNTPNGQSAVLDLQYMLALQAAADLESNLGEPALAQKCRAMLASMRGRFYQNYWDAPRRLFADTPQRQSFSQHTNALATLAKVVRPADAGPLMSRVLADTSLAACTIYFSYYLHRAAIEAGLGQTYLTWLGPWRRQMANGLSTWAESPEPARSDCHAWGAHPNIELLRAVLGVESAAPGFAAVRIEPRVNTLQEIAGTIPHPRGLIAVRGKRTDKQWQFTVALPQGVNGWFWWGGKPVQRLQGGQKEQIVCKVK